ncbi:MAG: hypothetical protein ACRDNS_33445 [Trebonia sp.]
MRHVIGIGLAIGLAAAVFFAGGWGYLRLLRVPVANGGAAALPAQGGSLLHDSNVLYAFAAVAGPLLLAGILIAVRRISPLAAGLPGLVLVAWTVVYGFNVGRAVRYIPLRGDSYGLGFEAMLMNGVLAAVGLALVVPLFVPSRWPAQPALSAAQARDATQVLEPTSISSIDGDPWSETAPYQANDPEM